MVKLLVFDVSGTLINHQGQFYPGMLELLHNCKNAGYKIALATNLSRGGLNAFMQQFQLSEIIDSHVCASEADYKPSLEMLHIVGIELDILPHEVLMIGDSEGDMVMGQAYGAKTCAVSWDYASPADFHKINVDYRVEKTSDLADILLEKINKN